MLAYSAIERECTLNGVFRRKFAAANLDQRNEVRRVEGVAENDTLRVSRARILEFTDGNCRRAGRKQRIRRRRPIQPTKQVTFDVDALGAVLLDEVHFGNGLFRRSY